MFQYLSFRLAVRFFRYVNISISAFSIEKILLCEATVSENAKAFVSYGFRVSQQQKPPQKRRKTSLDGHIRRCAWCIICAVKFLKTEQRVFRMHCLHFYLKKVRLHERFYNNYGK